MAAKYTGFDQMTAISALSRKAGRAAAGYGGGARPTGAAATQIGKAGGAAAQMGHPAVAPSDGPVVSRPKTYVGGTQVNQTGNARSGLSFRQYVDAAHPGMVMHEYTINGERHVIPVPVSKPKPGLRY